MLARLYIRNFALINESEIRFGEGLNILTGETGAGKSLLLGALGLILGKRVDYSMLFNPDEKCIVEAEFTHLPKETRKQLDAFEDFDLEGESIIIRREATAAGKSRAFVNDTPVSLQTLKEVTGMLVDLHGQHENQLLLSPVQQLHLLDQYGKGLADAEKFAGLLKNARSIREKMRKLQDAEREARKQEDYLRFQVEELDAAKPDPEEAAELDQRVMRLQNSEELREALGASTDGIYDGEDSIYSRLSGFRNLLRKVAGKDEAISNHLKTLEEAASLLQEVSRDFQHILDELDVDPEALQEAELRLDTYNRLKMKFSAASVEELIEIREGFRQKLNEIGSLEGELLDLEVALRKAEKETVECGLNLEKIRNAAIPGLEKAVNQLLADVGFQNAAFRAALSRNESAEGAFTLDGKRIAASPDGFNKLEFRIRTNKGVPEGNLSQTASGGEISRVMLAIKAALAGRADLAVLIFDEIDTGISGETARKVGQVMKQLGKNYQIIAITHLPQIAGMGNQHYHIYKEDEGDQTISRIRELSANERVEELARMISGAALTPSAIENARELLKDQVQ